MDKLLKNKVFTWLIALLFLANLVTLAIFWVDKLRPDPPQQGGARAFIIRELNFTKDQEHQYDLLVKEHRDKAQSKRGSIREAKEEMFSLLKQEGVTDSAKRIAARKVSSQLEELDLSTLDHFQKVRLICNAEQREKFDRIINRIIGEMGRPGMRDGPPQGPRGGVGGERLPPPPRRGDGSMPSPREMPEGDDPPPPAH
jgi:Spy/CpxP family protein refolding chaperone